MTLRLVLWISVAVTFVIFVMSLLPSGTHLHPSAATSSLTDTRTLRLGATTQIGNHLVTFRGRIATTTTVFQIDDQLLYTPLPQMEPELTLPFDATRGLRIEDVSATVATVRIVPLPTPLPSETLVDTFSERSTVAPISPV